MSAPDVDSGDGASIRRLARQLPGRSRLRAHVEAALDGARLEYAGPPEDAG